MATSTGYGPSRRDNGSRWSRLLFDGDETKYEIWETKFLAYLHTLSLKDAILGLAETKQIRKGMRKHIMN